MDNAQGEVMNQPRTRADRLHAIIAKVAPKSAIGADGKWPNRHPQPGVKRDANNEPVLDAEGQPQAARHSGPPYEFDTLPDGRRRLRVTSDDGDVISGVGDTTEAVIAAIEQKLGLSAEAK